MIPPRMKVDVVDMGPGGRREAVEVACRAFEDDPLFVHLYPRLRTRLRAMRVLDNGLFADCVRHGAVHGAVAPGAGLVGVAMWMPPGTYPPGRWRLALAMARMLALPFVAPAAVGNLFRLVADAERAHTKEEHWYLALLGVDPVAQGLGAGNALMGPALAQADAEGFPCWLECIPKNVPYYVRHGFEAVEELRTLPGGPPVWTMNRKPRSPGPAR